MKQESELDSPGSETGAQETTEVASLLQSYMLRHSECSQQIENESFRFLELRHDDELYHVEEGDVLGDRITIVQRSV